MCISAYRIFKNVRYPFGGCHWQESKKVNDFVFTQMQDKVVIKLAHFDQDAGIIGAALLTR